MRGILMEEFCESRPKITQICQISIKIQVPHNEFQRDMFENLDIKNQILGTCGSYEPLNSPFFSCVIAQYFWSFFFEHPVFEDLIKGLEFI